MKILVIEDDPKATALVVKGLREHGHDADHVDDGAAGLKRAQSGQYDVLIVDRRLPSHDGMVIVRALRATGNDTPVLILSALGSLEDRLYGLRNGGDDYLTKPCSLGELIARVEILGRRRSPPAEETRLKVGDLEMDLLARKVRRAGRSIELHPREFKLLEYLARNAGNVVTRTMLLENVWEFHFDPQTNVIEVHIARLRQKIDKDFPAPLIHTVRGSGYCLRA
ncbi:response regulator transcription factor [Azospirillum picis]|uniref:Two-component system OmpR family response regulator n=1 Tax=Azospirillum picis TaxID=488438 RepID=A0ABU0MTN8_9PROT|nr:response regulator transcription factor [Azospirillum picis]MBP2303056.1 two-component system OmpR family response regulator [Azospirillum picis]MDQ0536830.1 two-component system OmpR family response regulator [Azospirillum picis]